MKKKCEVLQYEFFHVGGNNVGSFLDIVEECLERISDNIEIVLTGTSTGSEIKTVVRIYDLEGEVTIWAKQVIDLEAQREIHIYAPRKNPITDWYAKWQIARIDRQIDSLKELILSYFIRYIDMSFKQDWNVSREIWDHTFCPARRDEYIELHEAATMSKGFWLFIFEPNDLLAGKNKKIVSVI